MRDSLIGAISSLGDIANNLQEAARWFAESQNEEEAKACLESVNMATSDALEKLLALSGKCREQLGEEDAS